MKRYKETWTDAPWYGDIVNKLSSKKYCKIRLGCGAGEPPVATIILPTQLAYRLTEYCRKLNYCNRYYINVNQNGINIDSFLIEVHRDFREWKNIKIIRKLIYG